VPVSGTAQNSGNFVRQPPALKSQVACFFSNH
jgi:hypothetical protein